jgi:uncharacterized protein (DUF2235 family)
MCEFVSTKSVTASTLRARLIILLDGTWQTDMGVQPPTNVVRLRDLILPKNNAGEPEFTQHIYYDSGVGTGGSTTRRSWAGATGHGLEDIVRGAYRQICHRYQPGMEIYVFGFSRGAFSARSLVGYINASGLLKAEHCSASQEKKAWEFYRKPRRYRIPAEKLTMNELCWPETPRIKCLGVFDTVGARGIPLSMMRRRNAERYGFHDTTLSSIVDHAFHALALDEKRRHYVATLWSNAFHHNNKGIEQVWFPGCHSDVGGGVSAEGLSSLSLYWMIRRMEDNGLGLVLDAKGVEKVQQSRDETTATLGGKGLMYQALATPAAHRMVNQTRPDESEYIFKGLERHLKPMREAVHWSVFGRMAKLDHYRPRNICHEVFWQSVYLDDTPTDTDVVGLDDRFLNWWENEADYNAMLKLLPSDRIEAFKGNSLKYVEQFRQSKKAKS